MSEMTGKCFTKHLLVSRTNVLIGLRDHSGVDTDQVFCNLNFYMLRKVEKNTIFHRWCCLCLLILSERLSVRWRSVDFQTDWHEPGQRNLFNPEQRRFQQAPVTRFMLIGLSSYCCEAFKLCLAAIVAAPLKPLFEGFKCSLFKRF